MGVQGLDKSVSRVVLGTMVIHTDKQDESFALLDAAYECGINTFDTAAVYGGGESEKCLGDWCVARGLHDKVVILDKGCHPDAEGHRVSGPHINADLQRALDRLQTDCVDVYMLHRDNTEVPVGEIVTALNEHHAAGRISAFGASNWTLARLQEAAQYAEDNSLRPFAAVSPNYGLADQVENPWGPGCTTLTGPDNAEAREWLIKNQVAVFAYSSLARGLFSGRVTRDNYKEAADEACQTAYCHEINFARLDRTRELAERKGVTVTQIALAFALTGKMNMHALVGAENRQECGQNAAALDIELTDEERVWLLG